MKAPPTTASPILFPVERPATTVTTPSTGYSTAASPGRTSSTPVSGGPTGTGFVGRR